MSQAAEVTGLSESTVRRWVDNWIAAQAGRPLPYPGQGQLKGWRLPLRAHPAVAGETRGQERRVDPDDAARVAATVQQQETPPGDTHGQ